VAYAVAARWRAKEGCEDRLAQVIAELIPLSRLEPGRPFYQANCSIEDPRLFTIFYDDRVGRAG
jgi:quinol monooxygenase YgiN